MRGGDQDEEKDLEEGAKPIDPFLQLITFFSRSALTEGRCVCVCVHYKRSWHSTFIILQTITRKVNSKLPTN